MNKKNPLASCKKKNTLEHMNLHPLFVHFPIALLTVYSIFEVLKHVTKGAQWLHIRAVLVVTGTIGAFISLSTGEQAEHLFNDASMRNVLKMHSLFADSTTWIYAVLAVSYIVHVYASNLVLQKIAKILPKPFAILSTIARKILTTPLATILAIVGFIGLSFVGALGAILVYGPNFDPMTAFVYTLLF
jgi:uncharacterized membrane protein